MRRIPLTTAILMVILFGMTQRVCAQTSKDTTTLNAVFSSGERFNRNIAQRAATNDTLTHSIYMSYDYYAVRRNFLLHFVPTMYPLARHQRRYKGETFGKIKTTLSDGEHSIERVVSAGNVSRHNKLMPALVSFATPHLYEVTLFDDQLLSPFHRNNRKFYKYSTVERDSATSLLLFNPKTANTQLVSGFAIIDKQRGRVLRTEFSGDFDMLDFTVDVEMWRARPAGEDRLYIKSCDINSAFGFIGNRVNSNFKIVYDCPDSLEQRVQRLHEQEQTKRDTIVGEKKKTFGDAAWDAVDEYLLSAQKAEVSNLKVSLSPLFNPLHLGYSGSTGLSYKMDLGLSYTLSPQSNISFKPRVGYNFKIKQLYLNAPLRFTFNNKRRGWLEFTIANGNRLSDSRLLDIIEKENRDTIDFDKLDIDYFKDHMMKLTGNIALSNQVELSAGIVYHQRTAENKTALQALGQETVYRSFAPTISLYYTPWKNGPVFSGIFQRSLKGAMGSNMEFEKYEFDMSYKKRMAGLQKLSLRLGGGFYTNMKTTYFIDFVNFHQNYLPGGWDDDWEGEFQLINDLWYNASKHYVRLNASYESPMMILSHLPLVGRYVETERLYFSALNIEHTRPYFEIGYGLANRYFSMGAFASIVGKDFYQFGYKFSFELFRRW